MPGAEADAVPSLRVGALILAAGSSTRMGAKANKLLQTVEGKPLLAWPVDAMIDAGASPVSLVLGHEAESVRSALGERGLEWIDSETWEQGMGASIGEGVRELTNRFDLDGLLICVGDLPGLRGAHVRRVVDTFQRRESREAIIVPAYEGRRGHPVLFGAEHFGSLAELQGEAGARSVIEVNVDRVVEVALTESAIVRDVDTPEDLATWRG